MRTTPNRQPPNSVAGFVLAGGRSSRMGSDKALALFGGVPLIENALGILAEAQLSARIAGSRSCLAGYAEEIPDTFPDSGPMGGMHASLMASAARWNLFLPVDLPLMPSSLLVSLLERAQVTGALVTVARLSGRTEPLPVVLHSSVLPAIAQRLSAGETACHRAWDTIPREMGLSLDAVSVESLLQCGQCRSGRRRSGVPPVLWFQSANTPQDLARLNRVSARLQPSKVLRQESQGHTHSQVI